MMNLSDRHPLGFHQGPPLPLVTSALDPTLCDAARYCISDADNGWQLFASALVGLQSVPGLIILYGSMVKKKWAVNSAFMALYAFAAVLICWVLWAHRMSFDDGSGPLFSRPAMAVPQAYLTGKSMMGDFPNATYVFYQFAFAAITVILLAGSLLGRMNFYAWMAFVPLWLTTSYTVGAFTLWGNRGFLHHKGVVDFAGGYVVHLSSGVAGFTAAYWVGPRLPRDRQHFPPNNIINMLFGAGLLWLGWSGFNGGAPGSATLLAPLAILNTHLCTATSLSIWLSLDMIFYRKSSVIGAVQGMITGLVCITPAAGLVEPWAAMLMGLMSGSLPWYTMMVLHRRTAFFQKVDDTLGAFHTHAVAGTLGGLLTGFLAHPRLTEMFYSPGRQYHGLLYSFKDGSLRKGFTQLGLQVLGATFTAGWNVVITTVICLAISRLVPLRMSDEDLKIGDDAVHGEEAYALWGDGESTRTYARWSKTPALPAFCRRSRGSPS